MTNSPAIEPQSEHSFVFSRWKRFGHDRLYVSLAGAPEGEQLGYRDLVSGSDHPTRPADAPLLAAAVIEWSGHSPTAAVPAPPTDVATSATTPVPWRDLSLNEPGASAHTEAVAKRAEAPVKTTLARVLRVHTDERAWRIGAKGERLVAEQLDKLARRDRRWTAIHAIPVGKRGTDIDHLVIGPGGVFSVNAKHHPDANLGVNGETFTVNGSRKPYVRNSRYEAERATRLLSAAVGRSVPVTGLIVPVGCKLPIQVMNPPGGVYVVTRRELVWWFSSLGQVWTEADLTAIWEAARRSTTWTR